MLALPGCPDMQQLSLAWLLVYDAAEGWRSFGGDMTTPPGCRAGGFIAMQRQGGRQRDPGAAPADRAGRRRLQARGLAVTAKCARGTS